MSQRDAIEVLTHDHREVEEMFAEFKQSSDPEHKKTVTEQIVIELVRHSIAEEEYLYPKAKDVLSNGEALVEDEIKEHQQAEETMNKLEAMEPQDPGFDAVVMDLQRQIEHHVEDEEGKLFPELRTALSQDQLTDLGHKLELAKKAAPTRPHPSAPNHPPFNKLAAPGAALVDRVRDWLSGRGKD